MLCDQPKSGSFSPTYAVKCPKHEVDWLGENAQPIKFHVTLNCSHFRKLSALAMSICQVNYTEIEMSYIIYTLQTLSQFGLPGEVFVLKPVIMSTDFFAWIKSNASWSPMPFISSFFNAEVMCICISRKFFSNLWQHCSTSSSFNKLRNHSKERWERLIQKKSTWKKRT